MSHARGEAAGATIRARELRFHRPGGFELYLPEWNVDPGACVACIGPSGSGKSTLLDLTAGILTAAEGSLDVDGVALRAMSEPQRRRFRLERVGFVFQDFALLEHLSVRDNVLLRWRLGPKDGIDDRRAQLARLAAGLGIAELLERTPDALSQGERQRAAICQALVGEPRLVLADEPTGNLDPETTQQALEVLLGEVKARGATLVCVTHDHGLLDAFDAVLDLGPPGEVQA